MDSLADLRDLIIGRLHQAASLTNDQTVLVAGVSASSMEDELQINRGVIRLLGVLKRQEKERVESESVLLENMRNLRFLSSKAIDDVLSIGCRYTQHARKYSSTSTLPLFLLELRIHLLPIVCAIYWWVSLKSIIREWHRESPLRC